MSPATLVLATTLDGVLRLLHPFMPFLTEELFQRLHTLGVAGSGSTDADATHASVMTSAVQCGPQWHDDGVERDMADVLGVVHASRSLVKTVTDVVPDVKYGPCVTMIERQGEGRSEWE